MGFQVWFSLSSLPGGRGGMLHGSPVAALLPAPGPWLGPQPGPPTAPRRRARARAAPPRHSARTHRRARLFVRAKNRRERLTTASWLAAAVGPAAYGRAGPGARGWGSARREGEGKGWESARPAERWGQGLRERPVMPACSPTRAEPSFSGALPASTPPSRRPAASPRPAGAAARPRRQGALPAAAELCRARLITKAVRWRVNPFTGVWYQSVFVYFRAF